MKNKKISKEDIVKLCISVQNNGNIITNSAATKFIEEFGLQRIHDKLTKNPPVIKDEILYKHEWLIEHKDRLSFVSYPYKDNHDFKIRHYCLLGPIDNNIAEFVMDG